MTRKKVFLIGSGPLPMHNPTEMGFPALRTRQFLHALVGAGHDVLLACLTSREADCGPATNPDEPIRLQLKSSGTSKSFRYVVVRPDEPGRFLALRDLRGNFGPDVTVTAGPFLPMAAGARAAGDEPLWIDVPGDPMSEAQARASRSESDEPIHRYREMLGWALARGDQFSVISHAQRGPLIGALGMTGRMSGEALGHEWVQVLRGSVEGIATLRGAARRPDAFPVLPTDAFVALFSGGYNTWLDIDTMFEGLLLAMDQDPTLHFMSTGGALRGHDETSFHRFRSAAEHSPHADRFHFLGWVPADTLPAVYERAQVGLFLDLPCYEAEFGARTRILELLDAGLAVLGTDSCEQTSRLAETDLFFAVAPSNPEALAEQLIRLATRWREGTGLSLQGHSASRQVLEEEHGLVATTRSLLAWIEAPSRSPGGVPVDFLEDYWQELARLQERLEEVWKSPTWRYLGRLHRLLSRRRGS